MCHPSPGISQSPLSPEGHDGHVPFAIATEQAVTACRRTLEHQEPILFGSSGQETKLRKQAEGWQPTPARGSAVCPYGTSSNRLVQPN
jgi:hypothetical protein